MEKYVDAVGDCNLVLRSDQLEFGDFLGGEEAHDMMGGHFVGNDH